MHLHLQPNNYRASFRTSKDLTDMKTITLKNNIMMIVGKSTTGSVVVQSLLFPRSNYSLQQATLLAHSIERIL